MSFKHMPEPELQELLAQLARFYRANETRISADEVSKCLEYLPAIESSALNRMFSLIYQKKSRGSESGRKGQTNLPQWTPDYYASMKHAVIPGGVEPVEPVGRMVSCQNGLCEGPYGDGPPGCMNLLQPCHASNSAYNHQQRSPGEDQRGSDHAYIQEQRIISSTFENAERSDRAICPGHIAALTPEEFDNQSTPCSQFDENTALTQQSSPITDKSSPDIGIVSPHQDETTPLQFGTDDEACSKRSLATCDDIEFSPNTKKLLESCKTDLGGFLHAIRKAKVCLPTGQGWEAAIATKKENVDIRDLMKIYHRFECHNIYRHVVEAEFHTGTHWIRDMRAALTNKLCQEFPERFPDQKAANKCLNWVDQGCRYQEWAGMFSETTDLGCLIALPSDVSHSAYTSRCTKEEMNAAVLKFKCLGIDNVVKDMQLTQLRGHIAATLREMTGRKWKDVGDMFQSTWKSPRLTARISSALVSQYSQNPTPPASLAADQIFGPTEPSMPNPAQGQPNNDRQQDSNTKKVMNDCAVAYNPFNAELSLSAYEHFMSPYPRFDDWYQHSNYTEEAAQVRLGPQVRQYTGCFQ